MAKRGGSRTGGIKIGRNAGSGRFTTVKKAQSRRGTHLVETIRKRKGK